MLIHVLAACHNRKVMTLTAFTTCAASAAAAGVDVKFFLFDDGSTDGTSDAVRALDIDIEVQTGDGNAFWARGMAEAERAALRDDTADALLWLNDDVRMDLDTITRLVAESAQHPGAILVGAVRGLDAGTISFSGYDRPGRHPLRLHEVEPEQTTRRIDTMNGNIVLVPIAAARRIGGIDGGFSHGLADIDYGLRAGAADVPLVLGAGTFGACPPTPDKWYPRDYPTILAAWRGFTGIKGGGHGRSLVRILRRHAPVMWLLYLGWTYTAWWVRALSRASALRLRGQRPVA